MHNELIGGDKMKKIYEKPQIEIIEYEVEKVLGNLCSTPSDVEIEDPF